MPYADAGTQTVWAGLMQQSVRPEALFTAPKNTSTPPAEMATDKEQLPANVPDITHSHHGDEQPAHPPTLIERRQGRPGLVARISLPDEEFNDDVPLSPPPTHAVLSPLPEANTRHAGHTPLIPRARSPAGEQLDAPVLPGTESPREEGIHHQEVLDEDPELTGSLVLPEKPTDPIESHNFSLDALNNKLVKIERQQRILRGEFSDDEDTGPATEEQAPERTEQEDQTTAATQPEPSQPLTHDALAQQTGSVQALHTQPGPAQSAENDPPLGRRESAESRKSGATEEVDGVILKTPPSNFGAPLGQL